MAPNQTCHLYLSNETVIITPSVSKMAFVLLFSVNLLYVTSLWYSLAVKQMDFGVEKGIPGIYSYCADTGQEQGRSREPDSRSTLSE